MRNLLFLIILTGTLTNCFGQDKFKDAISNLDFEFGFKQKIYPYETLTNPKTELSKQFKKCSDINNLEKLTELNFKTIEEVKFVELVTEKKMKDGYWRISFQEWKFENESCAIEFNQILNSMEQNLIQFCVSKGGIRWWRIKNNLYLIRSRSYFMTYHFDEIIKASKSML